MQMMGCGHTANATRGDGKQVCVICIGIVEGADVEVAAPDLTGRWAMCSCCKKSIKSGIGLPFFEYRSQSPYDIYYCGCRGWD